MKKTFYILLFCTLSLLNKAQPPNLVPNPSFENISLSCPNPNYSGQGQVNMANGWFQPIGSFGAPLDGGSTDLYSACFNNGSTITICGVPDNAFGYQYPRTGGNYCGFGLIDFYSVSSKGYEYLETKLISSFISGKKYCISFYWSRAGMLGYSNIKTDALQVLFTNDTFRVNTAIGNQILTQPSISNPIGNMLTDSLGWNLFSTVYVSTGNERFMSVGNFLPLNQNTFIDKDTTPNSINTCYYYFDDFSIYELPELSTTNDTTLCYGSSLQLKAMCSGCWAGDKYEWRDAQGNLLSNAAYLNLTATQTATYYVSLVDTTNIIPCSTTINDSIKVTVTGTASGAVDAGNDTAACINDTLQIGMPPIPGATYQWQPATGIHNPAAAQTSITVTQAQSYTLTQTTQSAGCAISTKDSINITLKPSAEATILEQDTLLCMGTNITLNALIYANTSCTWLLNNIIQSNNCSYQTTFYQTQQLVLQLNTSSNNLCIYKNTDTIHVQVIDCDTLAQITIPNVFTPNNDGINDMLDFRFKNLDFVSVEIYNRWGKIIMKNEELKMKNAGVITWNGNTTNGEPCSEGTYFYVLITKSTLGNKEVKEYKGFVTLIR